VAHWLERSPCMLIDYDFLIALLFILHFVVLHTLVSLIYHMNVCIIVHNDGEYRQMVMLHTCYCHYIDF